MGNVACHLLGRAPVSGKELGPTLTRLKRGKHWKLCGRKGRAINILQTLHFLPRTVYSGVRRALVARRPGGALKENEQVADS